MELPSAASATSSGIGVRLSACGGAHKPNAYDFGGGLVLEREWY